MEWTGLNELRSKFLKFFESKGHTILPSAPLVPKDDASLLLINSGMAPLKKYFLGLETPPNTKVTTCQKCIRTPDIERVGKTSRHGTYFEMLGNFSFGDYFKNEATAWAWEFITQELKIPVDRLWVSIYEKDDEAFEIWTKKVGVSPDRIVRLGKEDNFWEIGQGPCGPCSEIYFDRGEKYGCGSPTCAVGCDCDRYVEFWNLVFTQFNSDGKGNYTPLEHPNIDTGMGLERLACIMQGVDNLFEVDTVQNIMKHISRIAGVHYGENEKADVSLRVITDHIRSSTFMIGDGVVPQNEGRGYVLRRLLRRAVRHGRLIGIDQPFLYQVCETVMKENADAYPELLENREYIVKVIQVEEERFLKTLEQGMNMLNDIIDKLSQKTIANEERILSGEDVFKLYDTFGFPIDLTMEIAQERGLKLDELRFREYMEEQRSRARAARVSLGDVAWEEDVLSGVAEKGTFVGYENISIQTTIVAIVKDGELVETALAGDNCTILLEKTPFYPQGGGQVGDSGVIYMGNNLFHVFDCQKSKTGHIIHIGELTSGIFNVGDKVEARVEGARRLAIMRNHSACHLLQAALREVLGTHVHQAGSQVDEHFCRFDFSHFSAMTEEEIRKVEALVNAMIGEAIPVVIKNMDIQEAKKLGAMALFGEKYGNVVRVCNMGGRSIEFCGGTHVENTARIGVFKIVKESSVAAGVRRIEAVTGLGVLKLLNETQAVVNQAAEVLKLSSPQELVPKVIAITSELKEKEKEIDRLNQKLASFQLEEVMMGAVEVKGLKVLFMDCKDAKPDILRTIGDKMKESRPESVGLLFSTHAGKNSLLTIAGKTAVEHGVHAGKLMKEITSKIGGSGGGRPDNAMGGVPDLGKLREILPDLPRIVEKLLG